MSVQHGERALLVEDETGLQITLQDRLSSEGYEVSVKGDGVRGEEAAKGGNFDLIILDIMLPGRDGYTVCRNLRQAGIGVPILMLTARNNDLDTVMGLRQGADDYLGKPFDMGVLVARIEALLRRARQAPPGKKAAAFTGSVPFGPFILDLDRGSSRGKANEST
jgi:DNA-binding response OmpR family regulator